METSAKEIQAKLEAHLTHVDESALVILKGHLVIEETLSEILSTFVFHGEHLDAARLSFVQKVATARSMSLDEHNSEMWQLILAINSLRNQLAHALDSPKRALKTNALIDIHTKQGGPTTLANGEDVPEHVLLSFAISFSLGFLSGFMEEVRRFRSMLDGMDKVVNPHRHK